MLMPTIAEPGVDVSRMVEAAVERAGRAIPPLWPLASSVAVNPFLGQSNERLAVTRARLRRVAGVAITLDRGWYLDRICAGEITDEDLAGALSAAGSAHKPETVAALKSAAARPAPRPRAIPTVADLLAKTTGVDWPEFIAERIGHWAAGYFDGGQALWSASRGKTAWANWRATAAHDLTPEIMGLKRFTETAVDAPDDAFAAILQTTETLRLPTDSLDSYFHQLLTTLGGYAQYARYLIWQAELRDDTDLILRDLLAIRLTWEAALWRQYEASVNDGWRASVSAHAQPVAAEPADIIDEILQEAAERAAQRRLAVIFATESARPPETELKLQAAFCIDVRSEVLRRKLESLDPCIATLGFAGFFGLALAHRRFGSDVTEARLPVLLEPALATCSEDGAQTTLRLGQQHRIRARAHRAWGRFKLAAVSSFAFVEAAGPMYVGKLLRDALGLIKAPPTSEPPPHLVHAPDLEARVTAADSILRAMSLTESFARLVLIVGHGAYVVNNPHASTLHCGACGGYSGEVNARLLAGLLNDTDVRAGLARRGIAIPKETLFVGALHETTTETVTIYETDYPSAAHVADLDQALNWFSAASVLARSERTARLPGADGARGIARRARDWAETRPEWGLAGCKAFIAAPRSRTVSLDLAGEIFLHDYDWRRDQDYKVLELIMTAPVVVASWISLQYYGSCVAPELFGSGNKLLHNVTGGLGVVEGNGGVLRAGLPWQSVHDGNRLIHDPLRLTVVIEAPREAIDGVLGRHHEVRALFDNRWLHLFALDRGRLAWRYTGKLRWVAADIPETHANRQVEPA
jgi:uncharacterized protein YbcC (UPF0753/DUF2309 family)